MEEKIEKIYIVPARLIKYRDDGNVVLRCLQGETTVDRAFEPKMLKGIKSPDLLFVWVETGGNVMKASISDASEYEDLFHKKWDILFN